MQPAFSVIFLTTLIGGGQGVFLALYAGQLGTRLGYLPGADAPSLHVAGSIVALALLFAGLVASFFHLGRPERAWRTATRWRTSWLSREVIVLPALMATVALYGVLSHLGGRPDAAPGLEGSIGALTFWTGAAAATLSLALFLCTGMIYACMRFLQEWATPLTVINFTLLGSASGFTVAAAVATYSAPHMSRFFAVSAVALSLAALLSRGAALLRNARLRHKSTLQTAIGVRDHRIRQVAQGAMGGSFNTREFFHGRGPGTLRTVKWAFLVLVFPVPVALLWAGVETEAAPLIAAAAVAQLLGLGFERWYFFADATHPQNLYYQAA